MKIESEQDSVSVQLAGSGPAFLDLGLRKVGAPRPAVLFQAALQQHRINDPEGRNQGGFPGEHFGDSFLQGLLQVRGEVSSANDRGGDGHTDPVRGSKGRGSQEQQGPREETG